MKSKTLLFIAIGLISFESFSFTISDTNAEVLTCAAIKRQADYAANNSLRQTVRKRSGFSYVTRRYYPTTTSASCTMQVINDARIVFAYSYHYDINRTDHVGTAYVEGEQTCLFGADNMQDWECYPKVIYQSSYLNNLPQRMNVSVRDINRDTTTKVNQEL